MEFIAGVYTLSMNSVFYCMELERQKPCFIYCFSNLHKSIFMVGILERAFNSLIYIENCSTIPYIIKSTPCRMRTRG